MNQARYLYITVKADKITVDISEDDIGGGGYSGTYYIARDRLDARSDRRDTTAVTVDRGFLCWRGHWVLYPNWDRSDMWTFHSARAADDLVRRLNAGLPVHRDRWLGVGALLFLGAEVLQAIKWWP
ncbi:hypothetical protein [Candidatus Poriferisodalis sp.]|uniref:hypothetical protein n=1 Tax=Candidatus Poriferisodalis sp. TaxID=3101277 RepID=UPI003B02AD28